MKIVRIICLLLMGLLALSPLGNVLAQDEEEPPTPVLISEEEPEYELALTPMTGRYDTIAVAGRDKYFPIVVENLGEAAIDNIKFSADGPDGWEIEFSPDKVVSLEALDSEVTEIIIKTSSRADTGDYMVTIRASGEQVSADKIDIRVTLKGPVTEAMVELSPLYPRLEAIAGGDFVFEVEFAYMGLEITDESRDFNLRTIAPKGWEVYMTPPYEKEKKVSAIRLKPAFSPGNKLRVVATAPFWPLPEPGEYKITLEAISGEVKGSIEFKAVITAKYILFVVPVAERYNTTAKAGEDNFFSISVGNLGTAAVNDIKLSSTGPEGWQIEFSPDKVDSIEAIADQVIDVNIKPPSKTIAGDYVISLRASGKQTSSGEINIRVTVETPTIWGWVGVGIILVVVAGLVVIFLRFSRR